MAPKAKPMFHKQDALVRGTTMKYLEMDQKTKEYLAENALMCCRATAYRKLKDPGILTLDEFRRLVRTQGWTQEEVLKSVM